MALSAAPIVCAKVFRWAAHRWWRSRIGRYCRPAWRRSGRDAIEVHGAGATQRLAAAEFGAGHPQHVAQHPEQRRIAIDIGRVRLPVDLNDEGHRALLFAGTDQTSLIATSMLPRVPLEYDAARARGRNIDAGGRQRQGMVVFFNLGL
jgi:hypothetical protein